MSGFALKQQRGRGGYLVWLDQVIAGLPDSAEDDDYFGRVLAVLRASRHIVYLPLKLRQVPQPQRQFARICDR